MIHGPLENAEHNELHLLLHVTDVMRNLINRAMAYDEQSSSRISDILKIPMVTKFANRSSGISFNIIIEKKSVTSHHWWEMTKRHHYKQTARQIMYLSASKLLCSCTASIRGIQDSYHCLC